MFHRFTFTISFVFTLYTLATPHWLPLVDYGFVYTSASIFIPIAEHTFTHTYTTQPKRAEAAQCDLLFTWYKHTTTSFTQWDTEPVGVCMFCAYSMFNMFYLWYFIWWLKGFVKCICDFIWSWCTGLMQFHPNRLGYYLFYLLTFYLNFLFDCIAFPTEYK